jgi:alpha-tubulin suppressor-like RCC1 family protein
MAWQHTVDYLSRSGAVRLSVIVAILALVGSACTSDTTGPQTGGRRITPTVTAMLSGDSVQLHFPHGIIDTSLHWSATGGLSVSATGMLRAVYSGSGRVVASRTDSTGERADTLTVAITLPHDFKAVAVGYGFACALDAGGTAYCWGSNEGGRLATDLIDPNEVIVAPGAARIHAPVAFASIATGGAHACGLTSSGAAYCWGFNNHGQIGVSGAHDACPANGGYCLKPVLLPGGHHFLVLSLGIYDSCGLETGGVAYCWGDNSNGALGIGPADADAHPTPTPVMGGHTFGSISAGDFHTCAATFTSHLYCWGMNSWKNLGIDSTDDFTPHPPTLVPADPSVNRVRVADERSCILSPAGAASCWGAGWLGGAFSFTGVATPNLVSGGLVFTQLSVGHDQTCGLVAGTAYCWGSGPGIGSGTSDPVPSSLDPVPVSGGLTFSAISAGTLETCGISTGHVYCWGTHPFLGVADSTIDHNAPVLIAGQE